MSPYIIFLNGPPRSGKDTLAKHIVDTAPGFKQVSFAAVLKRKTHALYGLDPSLPHDAFEATKDMPNEAFLGLSPRQAYINVSEQLMKPTHGQDIFGQFMLKDMMAELGTVKGYVISDSGFESEALPLLRTFGANRCMLIRIVARKRGCSFKNDSRSYIELPCQSYALQNEGTEEEFLRLFEDRFAPLFQLVNWAA